MNIDFPPPSKGTYNNAGSSRKLCNYCEHEDMERMEQGIYTEGFFNLTDDNIYKLQVIKDIDSNIGQLLKTDAKFYAIHVSPSEKELKTMGNTEQEQAEAMKRYIREVVIPEYARNFNKGLSAEDIKFYGKIHFSRDRSNNELNMHCHLIVSRKDNTDIQANQTENKVAYKQDNSIPNLQSINQDNKKEDKQSFNLPDLGLSSALGLLTLDVNQEEEQTPMKKKIKKKPKRGFRQS